jgi:hypothetical protein
MRSLRAFVAPVGVTLAVGLAAAASASAAEPTNWSVKGKPLAPGESRALKLKSTTPIHIVVPELGLNIACKSKGAGMIVGAQNSGAFGTGRLNQLSFAKCGVEGEPGCEVGAKIRVEINIETDGELLHPTTWTLKVEINVIIEARAKPKKACKIEGPHNLVGFADSRGPQNQEIEFPPAPLPSTTLQFDGHRANIVGKYKLKAQGGTLSYG